MQGLRGTAAAWRAAACGMARGRVRRRRRTKRADKHGDAVVQKTRAGQQWQSSKRWMPRSAGREDVRREHVEVRGFVHVRAPARAYVVADEEHFAAFRKPPGRRWALKHPSSQKHFVLLEPHVSHVTHDVTCAHSIGCRARRSRPAASARTSCASSWVVTVSFALPGCQPKSRGSEHASACIASAPQRNPNGHWPICRTRSAACSEREPSVASASRLACGARCTAAGAEAAGARR